MFWAHGRLGEFMLHSMMVYEEGRALQCLPIYMLANGRIRKYLSQSLARALSLDHAGRTNMSHDNAQQFDEGSVLTYLQPKALGFAYETD